MMIMVRITLMISVHISGVYLGIQVACGFESGLGVGLFYAPNLLSHLSLLGRLFLRLLGFG